MSPWCPLLLFRKNRVLFVEGLARVFEAERYRFGRVLQSIAIKFEELEVLGVFAGLLDSLEAPLEVGFCADDFGERLAQIGVLLGVVLAGQATREWRKHGR